jgi:hypothetical protein
MSRPFDNAGDMCMGFFKAFYDAGRLPELPPGARVLELGCAEADWLRQMKEVRPDLHLTGIDARDHGRPHADRHIVGDIFTATFEPAEFDAIVAISVLHWAGNGHYGDAKLDMGDRTMMARARHWIKPTGWMYLDVAYNADGHLVRPAGLRAYSDASLRERLYAHQWQEVARQHFSPGHPDGPYVGLLLRPV